MDLTIELTRQLEDSTLSRPEQARVRCRLARELTEAGDYEAACSAMGELWKRLGERPDLAGLDQATAAEALLRSGSLSGWIGSARQFAGAQELAKDLISESISTFEDLGETEKVAEAFNDLALCYVREGAFDEARVTLQEALARLSGIESEQRVRTLINRAVVERADARFRDAFAVLNEAAPLLDTSGSHAVKGRFYNQLALVLRNLGDVEGRADYVDRALIEYAAASHHFEQAGHKRNCARVENNLGFLFLKSGKFKEANEHLDYARRIFVTTKDTGSAAQVDETRARVFLAQRRPAEAERLTQAAVQALEKGGEMALLVEALTTHGTAQARLGRFEQARATFERAIEVSNEAGRGENAGLVALTLLEEVGGRLTTDERRAAYERADSWLGESSRPEILARLRLCARRIFATQAQPVEDVRTPRFVYAAEQTAGLLRLAHRVAGVQSPVLISGETGTGKEEMARLIHEWSGRAGEFVIVNCASLTGLSVEAHLFGYQQGSFAGATQLQPGAARRAIGGTLLLDEIAALSLQDQGKLMRFIEHSEIHSIGAPEPERLDVRIIATTSRNLRHEVERGQFRDDLFYRLEAFNLQIPALRHRVQDIPAIAEHFLKKECAQSGKQVSFTPDALEALSRLPLKGNARQLRSLIERTVLTAKDGAHLAAEAVQTLALRQTQRASLSEPWADCSLEEEVLHYESGLIKRALETANGSVTRAARMLVITHQGLAFILQGRHKNLLASRTPARPRRRSLMRPVQR
ncbi:MAG: sigma 54-interacting transcriptional regulator [Pyrinomonadaceae bacterium]|nr:sigma 54-interacting transcriptional regulator [Pyrinomonadaceae bacterium]